MFRVLGLVLGNGTVVAVLLALGAALYHGWRTGSLQDLVQAKDQKLGALVAERDQWRDAALASKSRADRLAELQKSADESVRHLQAVLNERQRRYTLQQQSIHESPAADDGPVAPVLRKTLESLP